MEKNKNKNKVIATHFLLYEHQLLEFSGSLK